MIRISSLKRYEQVETILLYQWFSITTVLLLCKKMLRNIENCKQTSWPAPPIALIWVTKNCSLSTYCVQFPLRIYTAGTPTFSISSLKLKTTTGRNIQDHLHIAFFFYLTLISLNSTTNLNNAGFSFSIFNKGLVSIRSKNCFHCLETYEKQVKNCLESTE